MTPTPSRATMDDVRVLIVACAVVYGFLAFIMGVLPGITMSATPPGPGVKPLSPAAAHGREIYVSEGCAYCHTQQVRPLAQDHVWGRPSVAGDYAYSTPQLLGFERTGPDLSNIGARQPSDVWQQIHLYEPRAVVAESIMPAYKWLFVLKPKAEQGDVVVPVPAKFAGTGHVVVATSDVLDLVSYLDSLKQAPLPTASP